MADDFRHEIQAHHGDLSEGKGGWKLELNTVSWGDRPAKFDLRSWSPDHEKMGKGITLTREELAALKAILAGMEL